MTQWARSHLACDGLETSTFASKIAREKDVSRINLAVFQPDAGSIGDPHLAIPGELGVGKRQLRFVIRYEQATPWVAVEGDLLHGEGATRHLHGVHAGHPLKGESAKERHSLRGESQQTINRGQRG